MRQVNKQHGFALLMVIMLVAIGSVTMVTVGQTTMRQAVTAMRAQRQLQQRWAVRSLQRYLLPQCDQLLEKVEHEQHQALAAINTSITLGEESFDLVICDEQAKANINMLYEILGRERLSSSVRNLIAESNLEFTVHLKPHNTRSQIRRNKVSLPAFSSYNQLFANQSIPASRLVEATKDTRPLTEQLTFWGNGKVNLCRVSPAVLYEICEPYLDSSQIGLILERREEYQYEQYNRDTDYLYDVDEPSDQQSASCEGPFTITAALADFELKDEQKAGLMKILTEESSCYSMWIIHRMPLRSWYHLTVSDQTLDTDTQNIPSSQDNDQDQDATQSTTGDDDEKAAEVDKKTKSQKPVKDTKPNPLTLNTFSFEW